MKDPGCVIYVLNHWGGISGLMLLRMIKHADKKAVLLVPDYVRRDRALKGMLENKIFDTVIFFNDRPFYKISPKEKMLEDIMDYFDNLLQKNELDLLVTSEIYTMCDMTNSLGIYLLERNKQFTICELSRNTTFLRSRYDGAFNDGWMGEPYYKYQKTKGLLCGEKGNCDIMVYPRSDIARIEKETKRYSIFDFGDYSKLTAGQADSIMSCFNVNTSSLDSKVQLVLLSSRDMCNGHSVYSREESTYVFQVLLQYFGETKYKRIIKPHPSDTIEHFEGYFPGASFLESDFPIEFVRLSDSFKIPELLTITSSGADKISDLVGSSVEVGWIFYKIVPYLTRLDLCYRLINKYTKIGSVNQSITPKWDDLEKKFTRLFIEKNKHGHTSFTGKGDMCYIRNKPDKSIMKTMDDDSLMLFFEYDTFSDVDLDHVVTIKIEFYPLDNSYFGKYMQWIYGYTHNPQIKKRLESASMRFSLKETGQEVSVQGLPVSSLFTLPLKSIRMIADNLNGRKIVTWGIDEKMESDLYDALGILVTDRVYWNKNLINTESDHHFPWINDKRDKIYLICWNIRMDDKLSGYFSKNGFIENKDFILITPPPQRPPMS